jgi:purine nucleosidase
MHRRHFLKAASAAGLAPLCGGLRPSFPPDQRPTPLLIDADTANEIDDLYAIVRALLDPGFDAVGLSSAQWNHRLSPADTVLLSQKLNEDLVALLGRHDLPTPLGAEMIMGKPWGGDEPRDSPAAQLLIRAARRLPAGEKLVVASLGAVTNVASALKLAPDIIPRIACYMLSGRFYPDRGVWDKDEFNLRNDLNAANFLFNTEGLELHVMPVNILLDFTFRLEEVMGRLAGKGGVWDYLAARWLTHSPSSETWIMWDLALVLALARPELATQARFPTPPENTRREVFVYTAVDEEAMRQDWWRVVEKAQDAAAPRR